MVRRLCGLPRMMSLAFLGQIAIYSTIMAILLEMRLDNPVGPGTILRPSLRRWRIVRNSLTLLVVGIMGFLLSKL